MGGRRGELTPISKRREIFELIDEARGNGARLVPCCDAIELCVRTYKRWFRGGKVQQDKRPLVKRSAPANKLSERERQQILAVCNETRFAQLPPTQIVPSLLDQGHYLASEASFYRILKAHDQLHHRGRSQAPRGNKKPGSYTASGSNEVWSWDITYMASFVKGQFYYLYLFEDIYSRKIVGYEVHERECGELAAQLVQRCKLKEQCIHKPLVLHSDNGAPMKSQTMKAKLEELSVSPSHSRPRVSNDNPYSESLFRTIKYRPEWPSNGFKSLEEARNWVQRFVSWYNNEHKHSKLNFVTPSERHTGQDVAILAKRKEVLEAAKRRNPVRWSGSIRNCESVGPVSLNPEKPEITTAKEHAA